MADRLNGRIPTVLRLLCVQASWSYERMQGIGMGWASLPALRRLFGPADPRFRPAVARAAGFFNANPFVAGAALGAELRVEADGAPGEQVERLRTALCGPLGSLGDRLYWTGIVPALSAIAVTGVALGLGIWPVVGVVVVHNLTRLWLAWWLVGLGWQHGLRVGTAVNHTPLPGLTEWVGVVAVVTGFAVAPVAGAVLLRGVPSAEVAAAGALMAGLLILRRLLGPRGSALRLTIVAASAAVLWQVIAP